MDKIVDFFLSKRFYSSLIVIAIFIIVYFIIKKVIDSYFTKNKKIIDKRKTTYLRLFKNIIKYILILIIIVIILEINGINVASILAGLGIVSVIGGLALQDALKDIIMGFNLIVDNYFSVGDVVKINNVEGVVVALGLKNTKIRGTNPGGFFVIANRNITEVLILNDLLMLDIPLSYKLSTKKATDIINKIITELEKDELIEKVEYKGIDEFEASSIKHRIFIYTKPEEKLSVKRIANYTIKKVLDDNKVEIPFNQIDVHTN